MKKKSKLNQNTTKLIKNLPETESVNQQANSNTDTRPPEVSSRSADHPKFWRAKLLLERRHLPLWSIILAIVTVAVALAAALISYFVPRNIQSQAEENALSHIKYAFFIQPSPVPGESFDRTRRWEVSIMITNTGPATSQAFILELYTPDPQIFLHSSPEIMSSPAAAEVQIHDRIPNGIYQIVFKNFLPGDQCFLHWYYATTKDKVAEFNDMWKNGGMFDKQFGKRFITQFWFSGERLKVENMGGLNLEPLSAELQK